MPTLKVRLTFTESILGTLPGNEDIYRDFIASKAPNSATEDEEVDAMGLNEQIEKAMTGFPRTEDGRPFLYDYQIKGFFKDACSMLSRLTGKDPVTGQKKKAVNESSRLTAYRKVIDGLIFPAPREIPIITDKPIGVCQRPLRAQTAQGERIALAMSEEIAAGAVVEFSIRCLDEAHIPAVREWLDYGALRGIGQWRNASHGRFTWEEIQ